MERVVMHVNNEMAPYIQTKPLHPSQKFRKIDDNTFEVEIKVIPNLELNALLLSFGKHLKVIEPLSLREKLKAIIQVMSENYN